MSEDQQRFLIEPDQRLCVEQVADYSSYFKRSLNAMIPEDKVEEREQFLKSLLADDWTAEKIRSELSAVTSSEVLGSCMRKLRRRIMMSLIAQDVTGTRSFDYVVRVMSDLAQEVVTHTVRIYARELAVRFGVPHSPLGVPQDLLVIGMGKLGGGELNVSSDIDLIFFYDEDGDCQGTDEFPNPRKQLSNHEFYDRLAKKIIPAISDLTYDGFVFRVDMRLRPNGDSGPMVGSSAMLEEYLMTQGRDWERFAWSKGRIVSGPVFTNDEQFEIQCKNLNDVVRPFVYRKYLDFGAIASLTNLHAKIRASSQQRQFNSLTAGSNVKLGRGGIREIEFIVQTFQIIRGGREAALREKSTLKALKLLGRNGVIEQSCADRLREIYIFLRNVEHALQYVDDQQTQLLPDDPSERERIAKMLGMTAQSLSENLKRSNDYVAERFDAIFQTKDVDVKDDWPLAWEQGSEEAQSLLKTLLIKRGFNNAEALIRAILNIPHQRVFKIINSEARVRLLNLVQKVVDHADSYIDASEGIVSKDEVVERYLRFLEVICGRPTYVSLLQQYPTAARKVGRLLASSRWASDYLLKHPILLDELLDDRDSLIDDYTPVDMFNYTETLRERLASVDEDDQETRMNLLREAHHAKLFRLLLADLAGRLSVERLADHLSALADATLGVAIEESWKTVPGRFSETPKFTIIAYGKLGGKELGYASDLDLIFLYDDDHPDAEKIYVRFARRLMNWLTITTSSGFLFDVDMRLRPNGESGMLVSSMEAFRKYELNEDGTGAWLWEHQALTRGRYCVGDADIGRNFEQLRNQILCRKRDAKQTAHEVLAMRQRMRDGHQNDTDQFDVKHDAGGMVDIEFMVQFLVLTCSNEHPELVNNFGNIKLLSMFADAGLIDAELAEKVAAAYRKYRKFQHEFRLNSGDSVPVRTDAQTFSAEAEVVRRLWQDVFGTYQN